MSNASDQVIIFHDVTWEDYERVLQGRGDKSVPRIRYLERELEILSPSRDHERVSLSSDASWKTGASIAASR